MHGMCPGGSTSEYASKQASVQACTSMTSGSRPMAALQAAALSGSRHSAARSCANTETAHARYDVLTSVAVVELQRVNLVVRVPAQASPGKVAEAMSKATGGECSECSLLSGSLHKQGQATWR